MLTTEQIATLQALVCELEETGTGEIHIKVAGVIYIYADGAVERPPALSRRELETLQLYADGKSRKQLAAIMGISPRAIRTYEERAMCKLECKTILSAVVEGVSRGWVRTGEKV